MEATPLSFLHAIGELKHLARTGWLRNIPNPESVAAHSFRVAIMAMLVPVSMRPFFVFMS
jgi:5'-deoxynucleotidase YfbR-like HD superfamily hydrolase